MNGRRLVSPRGEAEAVRIWMLGGFRVAIGARPVEKHSWRLRKASALVKLLALAPGHRLHREQVMDLLWPQLGRKAASNNLRNTLHSARTILDPAAGSRYLASEDDSLVLGPGGKLWVAVDAFEEAAVAARRSGDPAAYIGTTATVMGSGEPTRGPISVSGAREVRPPEVEASRRYLTLARTNTGEQAWSGNSHNRLVYSEFQSAMHSSENVASIS